MDFRESRTRNMNASNYYYVDNIAENLESIAKF